MTPTLPFPFSSTAPHAAALGLAILVATLGAATTASAGAPEVIAPPESFFDLVAERDREVAREFYHKYVDANGIPVAAAAAVTDEALVRSREVVTRMLAGRPDINQALIDTGMYVVIIGRDQVYTDMPEYRHRENPDFWNERVRGTGGLPTSFGEENILSLPIDRYDDESIAVHEFAHSIDSAIASIDDEWPGRLGAAYASAMEKGLYANAYAAVNAAEYWAESVQAYFDCNRVNNWNHGPIGTREQLRVHDPDGYELVRSTFNLTPETDWRYSYLRQLPNVIPPPEQFGLDPWYEKFTYARELPVVGRGASDEALLASNSTIRRMFAYRQDILKAFIHQGGKLVVLARDESLADLPEYAVWRELEGFDPLLRTMNFCDRTMTFVVAQENVLSDPRQPMVGDQQVVAVLARAIYETTGQRPQEEPPGQLQQYELRVERIDRTFAEKVDALHARAMESGQWSGTAAMHSPSAYWTHGVLAYFDAAGQHPAPADAPNPVVTREALRDYDPGLHELVHETMAFEGRVDWRFQPVTTAD